MAKAKKTSPPKKASQHDYILLDRSGSMASKWSYSIAGVNTYARQLAKDKATKDILLTVAVFDSAGPFDILRKDVPATLWADIGDTEAFPRGSTPLYDAVGRLVSAADADAPEKAAIVIMTDGLENSSREHNQQSAKSLLDRCRAKGWQIIFLGADFDNAVQGADLGNIAAATMSFNSINAEGTMDATSSMRSAYSSTGKAMLYSDDDRTRAWEAPGSPSPKAKSHGHSSAR